MKQVISSRKLQRKIISLIIAIFLVSILLLINRGGLHIINQTFILVVISIGIVLLGIFIAMRKWTLSQKMLTIYYHVTDFTYMLMSAIVFLQFVFVFLFFPAIVDGPSMYPTLENRDFLIVRSINHVDRFDIVVIQVNEKDNSLKGNLVDKDLLIKRIIGIPGDHIEFIDGILHVNGQEIDEWYLKDEDGNFIHTSFSGLYGLDRGNFDLNDFKDQFGYPLDCDAEDKCRIPEGYYFIMGDNRNNSYDSSRGLGLFHQSQIRGFPTYRIRTITNWEKIQQ